MSRSVVLFAAVALILPTAARGSAQQPPPIPNATGVVAFEGSVDKTYTDAGTLLVKASDGVRHLFHVTKKTAVHGAEAGFDGLAPGSRVVVHYTVDQGAKTAIEVDRVGGDGLREMEGVVRRVDRRSKQLSLELADGSRETLQLSERAAQYLGKDVERTGGSGRVIVYYIEEDGFKVAHYFKIVREG